MLARARMSAEPTIALAIPPPASPTGFGVCVRNAQLIEPTPRYTRYVNIANNGSSTRKTVSMAAPVMTWSVMRRRKAIGGTVRSAVLSPVSGMGARRLAAGNCPDQQSRQGVHDNCHHEQSQADFDERREVDVAGGLAEFIRQHTGHGVTGRKQ